MLAGLTLDLGTALPAVLCVVSFGWEGAVCCTYGEEPEVAEKAFGSAIPKPAPKSPKSPPKSPNCKPADCMEGGMAAIFSSDTWISAKDAVTDAV